MLEVRQLTRNYGSLKAADNINFSIGKGEIVGLLGHNGAGKTTIMKMLSGYLEPNDGQITIDGLNLSNSLKTVQRNLGYLPESLPIYQEMSVADYLDYAADLKGLGADKHSSIKHAIQATDIGSKLLSPIATLSRGFKQRVGVAQAILGKPQLLILDEPTNGLDPTQTEHMRDLIREIAAHATVILSTHIMQEVDALCSRVLILRAGQLAVDAKLDELRQSNHLLVSTGMEEQEARSSIGRLPGIKQMEILPGDSNPHSSVPISHYRLTLADDGPFDQTAATVAKTIVEAGANLIRLQRQQRDLETLFKEVNDQSCNPSNQEGLNHAA